MQKKKKIKVGNDRLVIKVSGKLEEAKKKKNWAYENKNKSITEG